MDDIVERLRRLAERERPYGSLPDTLDEAAAEIERLRAGGCARDQGTTQYCGEAAKKDAEIASLLNALADERTESMKLRAALEWIAGTALTEAEAMAEKARAALEGKHD